MSSALEFMETLNNVTLDILIYFYSLCAKTRC